MKYVQMTIDMMEKGIIEPFENSGGWRNTLP